MKIKEKKKPVKLERIVANENNRFHIKEDEKFKHLVAIIKRDGITHGFIVKAESKDGTYQLLDDHRRLEAAKNAGIKKAPIIIIDEVMKRSEEISAIVRNNSRQRGNAPYDYALMVKDYYRALEEEGVYLSRKDKRELALNEFKMASCRSMYNYDHLSDLPEDILIIGHNKYMTRDQGLKLAKMMQENPQVAEKNFDAIREIVGSASNTKAKNIKELLMDNMNKKKARKKRSNKKI